MVHVRSVISLVPTVPARVVHLMPGAFPSLNTRIFAVGFAFLAMAMVLQLVLL
jgi:hypothetical protein